MSNFNKNNIGIQPAKYDINMPFNSGKSWINIGPESNISYVHKVSSSSTRDTYFTYDSDGNTSIIDTHKTPQGFISLSSKIRSWLPKWPFWNK